MFIWILVSLKYFKIVITLRKLDYITYSCLGNQSAPRACTLGTANALTGQEDSSACQVKILDTYVLMMYPGHLPQYQVYFVVNIIKLRVIVVEFGIRIIERLRMIIFHPNKCTYMSE